MEKGQFFICGVPLYVLNSLSVKYIAQRAQLIFDEYISTVNVLVSFLFLCLSVLNQILEENFSYIQLGS